ncbi:MAG: hypothetical protein ACFB0E_13055 [Leptolyngbyaceae cyanobacterium]
MSSDSQLNGENDIPNSKQSKAAVPPAKSADLSTAYGADAAAAPPPLPENTVSESALDSAANGRSPSLTAGADQEEKAAAPAQVSQSPPAGLVILGAVALVFLGFSFNLSWLTLIGALLTLTLSWGLLAPSLAYVISELSAQQRSLLIAIPASIVGFFGLTEAIGINQAIRTWALTLPWNILGSFGDFLGAIGQIFVALLALFVAWRQYIISRDLTLQQNRITQQQTIDAYFQGISDLVLDDEGLLEDWP